MAESPSCLYSYSCSLALLLNLPCMCFSAVAEGPDDRRYIKVMGSLSFDECFTEGICSQRLFYFAGPAFVTPVVLGGLHSLDYASFH